MTPPVVIKIPQAIANVSSHKIGNVVKRVTFVTMKLPPLDKTYARTHPSDVIPIMIAARNEAFF